MTDIEVPLKQERTKPKAHRALYHAVSEQRWSSFQQRVFKLWTSQGMLKDRQTYASLHYLPLLQKILAKEPDKNKILEIGSGPVCVAQYLPETSQTYVDPLLDQYRRLFPGVMPEKAKYMTVMAEKANLPPKSFDMILCFNTLSDVHNPELVLHQVGHALKPDGLFVVSIDVWSMLLARAHLLLSGFAPLFPRLNRLYSYTHAGFLRTLSRHFEVVSELRIQTRFSLFSFSQERLYICRHQGMTKQDES